MYGLHVEHRQLARGKSLARSLAYQLEMSTWHGKAVVVTDKPLGLMSAVRKQWVRMERKAVVERARTLKALRAAELSQQLFHLREVSFTAKPPDDLLTADVTFAKADDLMQVAPNCKVMYVTYDFPKERLHMITSWMPRNGMVVIYDRG